MPGKRAGPPETKPRAGAFSPLSWGPGAPPKWDVGRQVVIRPYWPPRNLEDPPQPAKEAPDAPRPGFCFIKGFGPGGRFFSCKEEPKVWFSPE